MEKFIAEMKAIGLDGIGIRHNEVSLDYEMPRRKSCGGRYLDSYLEVYVGCKPVQMSDCDYKGAAVWWCNQCIKQGLPCSWTGMACDFKQMVRWFEGREPLPSSQDIAKIA